MPIEGEKRQGDSVIIEKTRIVDALQARWNKTNGRGQLSNREEFDLGIVASEIEEFVIETGILTREDLSKLRTYGWR